MRTCEQYRELISLALDNEISASDMDDLQQHLTVCEECRLVYGALMSISDALADGMTEPPQELAAGVMFRIKAEQQKKRRSTWVRFAAAAACFVIVAVAAADIGLDRWKNGGDGEAPAAVAAADQPVAESDSVVYSADYDNSDDAPEYAAEQEPQPAPEAPAAPVPDAPAADAPMADAPAADEPAAMEPNADAPDAAEENEVSEAASASLMNITEAAIYTGSPDSFSNVSPTLTANSSQAIIALTELLSFSELTDGAEPEEEPLFTILAQNRDGEEFDITVWLFGGRLIIKLGNTDTLYVASGSLAELLAFIESA